MRMVLSRVFQKYMNENAHNPTYQEYLLRAKSVLSDAIADNHIVYSLSQERMQNYVEIKQQQVMGGVCADLFDDPIAIEILNGFTQHFVGQVLPVQRAMCLNKISAYERALESLQLEHSRAICKGKIDKNRGYIADMDLLKGSYEYQSLILRRSDVEQEKSGAELLDEGIKKTLGIMQESEQVEHISSIILPEKSKKRPRLKKNKKEKTEIECEVQVSVETTEDSTQGS
jgi:hypothetical protein